MSTSQFILLVIILILTPGIDITGEEKRKNLQSNMYCERGSTNILSILRNSKQLCVKRMMHHVHVVFSREQHFDLI